MSILINKEKILDQIDDMILHMEPDDQGNHPIALEVFRALINNTMPEGFEWFPVKEFLPPEGELVLITCQPKKGGADVNRAYWADGSWHGMGSMSNVTAWMPLPDPYKE